MKKNKSLYEGLQKDVRALKLPGIEVWENKYKDKDCTVCLETNEFTCICPKTGLPDFAVLYIDYQPDKWCVELKSFKLYLHSFRSVGIFHEHAANRILDDFVLASKPHRARIRAEFNSRGGIKTIVEREYVRK
ncbi:MAG: NADPH-dependent 7-cyano-7-deazaguanine reductase QueF [Omnitrophica bacterium RBG_13_46_9]|nr:MAG: NADPH-dependent 7-cyano-7-deazaguanine reductase QueF [Omnitrophica bacterium RBG_13_46_9]